MTYTVSSGTLNPTQLNSTLYAVIHEKHKAIPCMRCFLCAFGSYFRVRSLYQKNEKNL